MRRNMKSLAASRCCSLSFEVATKCQVAKMRNGLARSRSVSRPIEKSYRQNQKWRLNIAQRAIIGESSRILRLSRENWRCFAAQNYCVNAPINGAGGFPSMAAAAPSAGSASMTVYKVARPRVRNVHYRNRCRNVESGNGSASIAQVAE